MNWKGQAMVGAFIGISIASVVSLVVFQLFGSAIGLTTTTVTNETHAINDATLPDTFTVNNAPGGVVNDSETLWYINASDTTVSSDDVYLLERGTNYTADYDASEFNVTTLGGQASTDLSSGDQYNISYDGKPENYIEDGTTRAVVGFVPLGVALALFLASLSPIMS